MTRRLIESCARIAETTNTLQELAKTKERQDIEQLKGLNADLVSQAYLQAFSHIATAGVCVGLASISTLKGIGDASSAVTVGNKVGETWSTYLRAGETGLQGKQRIVDHRLNKGPEKRFDEFFQQYIRYVQEYQQALGNARRG
jgi:hypothetical protein